MKTNHNRCFTARKDHSRSWTRKHLLKEEASANHRAAESQILRSLRVGYLNADDAVFPLIDEVSNPWNWD